MRARTPQHMTSARAVDAVLRRGRVDGGRRAIYGELVRMARDWELRHPLVDGRGDLGSIDGDGAESADHTELRLTALGAELLRDTAHEGAQHAPDVAASGERRVLPARLPNLLVNGSFSLATGAASQIPPHNLREVVDAVIAYIGDPQIDTDGLMQHLPGPDFPTGAVVAGGQGLRDAYAGGRGAVTVRARIDLEPGPQQARVLVVSELPFMVSKGGRAGVLAEIRRAARGGKVRGVRAVEDRSDAAAGLRIVIEFAGDADPDAIVEQLHAHTRLQVTHELRLVASIGGRARTISLPEAIGHYVEHRREVVARAGGLRSEDRALDVVRRDLLDLAATHGDERRTEIR